MKKFNLKSFIVGLAVSVVILTSFFSGAIADRLFAIKPLDYLLERSESINLGTSELKQKVLKEESIAIDVAEKVSPAVVTVAIELPERRVFEYVPFGGFRSRTEGGQPQDIGTGFIVSSEGLIITNKHVVNQAGANYRVVTKDGEEYEVKKVSLDPSNDVAVLEVDPSLRQAQGKLGSGQVLQAVELGSSDNLKVGQYVIAIGTALGEFRHTITTGVISGLGRGIIAGSYYEGYVERLDDVIQTDAAINPGNSGGPLLNSAGQVIGINVAVASGAENVGFAIPIDIVKTALEQYEETGNFVSKPFLGVSYEMISLQDALVNDVPQGAYVGEVIEGSPAEKAGVKVKDIITKFDGEEVRDEEGKTLVDIISKKKAGQKVEIEVWRRRPEEASGPEGDGEELKLSATLSEFSE